MLAELGRFFREIYSKTLDRRVVDRLINETAEIMCKLELIYPPVFFDSTIEHLDVRILPDEVVHRGPVQNGCTLQNVDFALPRMLLRYCMDSLLSE